MATVTANQADLPTRRQLFEFEDLGWFPTLFRNAITDWLAATFTGVYEPVVPLVVRLLEHEGSDRVVDLCSGGCGPWEYLKRDLDAAAAGRGGGALLLTLTDRYPNVDAFAAAGARLGTDVDFRSDPVDARDVPDDLKGVRTMFTAFHHLNPIDARAVLADAAGAGRPIGIFEHPRRSWAVIRGVLKFVPYGMLRTLPRWRPKHAWQLALVPFIIATSVWDAVISQLRAYTPEELEQLSAGLDSGYCWEAGTVDGPHGNQITYLIGYPA